MNVTAKYPKVNYRSKSSGAVSNAGMLLLTETARALGLVEALSVELDGFARPKAAHLPGKAICDLAVMLAAGGDCPADVVMLRARPHLFGKVASDPTISRIVDDDDFSCFQPMSRPARSLIENGPIGKPKS